jgi:Ca2+-binding RTX toxin-like protein
VRGLIVFNRSAHLDNETGNSPDDFLRIVTPAIVGRANVNYVLGTSGRNAITGTNGADYFDLSLGGDDIVDGLDGDDGFFFGAAFTAGDQVEGGAGTNDQIGLDGDYTVTLGGNFSNVEVVVLMRGPGGTPNHFAITAANSLVASGQTLAVFGLQVETSITFDGAAESDGNLRIYGGTIDDTLIAGGGADWIFGGAGADTLSGGGGNDIFHYDDVAQSTADLGDTILDFAAGDNIDLSGIDAIAGGADDAFTFLDSGAFTNQAGQLRVVQLDEGSYLLQGDTNGDGLADFQLTFNVSDAHPITAGDFTL